MDAPSHSVADATPADAGAVRKPRLQSTLIKRNIRFRLVEAHASVRDLLRLEGAEDRLGRIDRSEMVADVVEQYQKEVAR